MAFSRDDLKTYETQPQVQDPNHDPWGKTPVTQAAPEASAEVVSEPPVEEIDGSTTEPQAEPVAAEADNPEVDNTPEIEEPADGRQPRNRAQERISELVDERNAVREYNKYLQTKLDELLRKGEAPKEPAKAAPQAEADDPAPTLESVGFDPVELTKKQNEWIQKQVEKRVESAVRNIETRQSESAVAKAFENRVAEFKKTAPDFDVVIANPQLPQLAPDAAKVLVRSENGPAIVYHLAKNPDLAVRMSKLDSVSQAAAIGRLEEQLSRAQEAAKTTQEPSKKAPPVKAVSKAPPPPKPVSGGLSPVKDMSTMTMDEWVAHDRARKIAERKAKQQVRQTFRR
jgi:hypothetical protein